MTERLLQFILVLVLVLILVSGAIYGSPCPTLVAGEVWSYTNQHGVRTKFVPQTGELSVYRRARVIIQTTINTSDWLKASGFSSERSWFDAFAENIRVGQDLTTVEGFFPESRRRHCERHCLEFGIDLADHFAEEEYEARAISFARTVSRDTISFVTFDPRNRVKIWVKYDVSNETFLIVNQRKGNVLTFHKLDEEWKMGQGYRGTLDFVLSQFRRMERDSNGAPFIPTVWQNLPSSSQGI